MQTVFTSTTHTGFYVGLIYGIVLLKYIERRLDTIRNKTLLTKFNFQQWNTNTLFHAIQFKLRVNTTNKHTMYDSTIQTAFLIRSDLYVQCIFPHYKQILMVLKILQANIIIPVLKK
jgi:hypothetical protein